MLVDMQLVSDNSNGSTVVRIFRYVSGILVIVYGIAPIMMVGLLLLFIQLNHVLDNIVRDFGCQLLNSESLSSGKVELVVFSACGGILTSRSMPVLTACFPVLA